MNITHPTLYIFAGKSADFLVNLKMLTEKTHPLKAAFFLHLNDFENIEKPIKDIKSEILLGESGLSLKRLNVFVIAQAEGMYESIEKLGVQLRSLISADFLSYFFTLAVLLNESEETAFKFLAELSTSTRIFDSHFLFSNRNENNVISPSNIENACKLLAWLPGLHQTSTYFNETLTAKSQERGQIAFASAGIATAKEEEPDGLTITAEMKNELQTLARHLEQNLATAQKTQMPPRADSTSPEIYKNIASVAAVHVSGKDLWGLTIKQAEKKIFGERASQFFLSNYKATTNPPLTDLLTIPLDKAAQEEEILQQTLVWLRNEKTKLTNELKTIENTPCPAKTLLLPWGVDQIKDIICHSYSVIHLIEQIKAEEEEIQARYAQIKEYNDYIRSVIKSLKNLPKHEVSPVIITQAELEKQLAINISLLRDDGLLREKFYFENESCLIHLVGGFFVDDLMGGFN